MVLLNSMTFHDFPGRVVTLKEYRAIQHFNSSSYNQPSPQLMSWCRLKFKFSKIKRPIISERSFYGSNDPTNNVKALKEGRF